MSRTVSFRVKDESLLSLIERETQDNSISNYFRGLLHKELNVSRGNLSRMELARHWAYTSDFGRLVDHIEVPHPKKGRVQAERMSHQIQILQAMQMHDRLMVVHCRQAGVSTAMAISAVAGALKGNDALYVAFKPQVSNRFIEICEAVASSLDAPNSRPTKDSLKVCGGWVYTASPGSLRAEPVDHVMIDNADYTLSGYHEYKTLERRADRVTLAMNGCTENWQNDIRDECVELRYSWTEVSAWTNDRIKHHAESMSRQAFRKEFGAPIENHREDTE